MSTNMFEGVEKLNEEWARIESVVDKIIVKEPDNPLGTMRVNGRIRLTYADRPILDCTARQKIGAVKYLPRFFTLFKQTKESLENESLLAVSTVTEYADKFTKMMEDVPCQE